MKYYHFRNYINNDSLNDLVSFMNELKDEKVILSIETLRGSVSEGEIIKEIIKDERIIKVMFVGDCGGYAVDLLIQAMRLNKAQISKDITMTIHLMSYSVNTSELLNGNADKDLKFLLKTNENFLVKLDKVGVKKKHIKKIAKYKDVIVDYDYLMKLVY